MRIEKDSIVFGYGAYDKNKDISEEFLLCELDIKKHEIKIQRDIFATLPLFYCATDTRLQISDDMEACAKNAKLTVNDFALGQLLVKPCPNDETLFNEISLLPERSLLKWCPGEGVDVTKLQLNEHLTNLYQDKNQSDFKSILEKTFESYWAKANIQTTAFEVSGGIDSATMPLYISRKYNMSLNLGSMRFPDDFGRTQSTKLNDLAETCNADLLTVDISPDKHYPLSRFFDGGYKPRFHYQYQEIYFEILSNLAKTMASIGIDTVFTGIGGDELFENIVEETSSQDSLADLARFFNKEVIIKMLESNNAGSLPTTIIADSAYYAGQSRNIAYINYGIWPISPLCDPPLYSFVQSLDIIFRANKNILRAYHQAIRNPKSIFMPSQNEHFGEFFDDSLKLKYEYVINKTQRRSYLEKIGTVDYEKLKSAFVAAPKLGGGGVLFDIFRVINAEVILQVRNR